MNLLIVYALIFLLAFIILGIKLGFKNKGYLASAGITLTIIIVGIVAGILPTKAGKCGENAFYIYNINKTAKIYGKGTIGGISKDTKNVIIGEGITEIGLMAFNEYENLESVEISEGVEKIGDMAFKGCSKLVNVELPKSLKFIGTRAFAGCESLENIKIPENVEQLCRAVFSGTKISEINIPDNTIINLEEFSEGKYAESYNGGTFYGCLNLKNISISQENKYYTIIDGVLFNKDTTKIVCYPSGKESDNYIIPDTVNKLDRYTFAFSNNLKKITISENVQTISSNAIYECENLEIIEIENGIKEINEEAIYNCYKLSDIYIPDSVTKIPITSVPLSQLDKYDEIKKNSGKLVNSNKVTIHCNLNSFAHKYAEAIGYNYVIIDE